jgi:hypothetical protein
VVELFGHAGPGASQLAVDELFLDESGQAAVEPQHAGVLFQRELRAQVGDLALADQIAHRVCRHHDLDGRDPPTTVAPRKQLLRHDPGERHRQLHAYLFGLTRGVAVEDAVDRLRRISRVECG